MSRWEYRYLSLFRSGHVGLDEAFAEFSAELAAAGADGWEAVGEVELTRPGNKSARMLLLKRPLPNS